MLGEIAVGKTCIINRYINDSFDEDCEATPHANFLFKEIKIPEKGITLKLELWDTPGNEKSRSLASIFCKEADIIILVYSVTDWNSFKELKNFWYSLANRYGTKNLSKILNINNK